MDSDFLVMLLLFPICLIVAVAAGLVWTVVFGPTIVAEKIALKVIPEPNSNGRRKKGE